MWLKKIKYSMSLKSCYLRQLLFSLVFFFFESNCKNPARSNKSIL